MPTNNHTAARICLETLPPVPELFQCIKFSRENVRRVIDSLYRAGAIITKSSEPGVRQIEQLDVYE